MLVENDAQESLNPHLRILQTREHHICPMVPNSVFSLSDVVQKFHNRLVNSLVLSRIDDGMIGSVGGEAHTAARVVLLVERKVIESPRAVD